MERLWVCVQNSVALFRSYDDIVGNGNPNCPRCGNEMRLTKASSNGIKDVLSRLTELVLV